MRFIFPLLFIAVPIAEIAAFIQIGNIIGLWPTLASIVFTAILGTALIRNQGLQILNQAQQTMQMGQIPIDSVISGLFLLIAAALLLTPGFITDALGFLLLWHPLRLTIARRLWTWFEKSGNFHVFQHGEPFDGSQKSGPTIEGEIVESSDKNEKTPEHSKTISSEKKSPWAE